MNNKVEQAYTYVSSDNKVIPMGKPNTKLDVCTCKHCNSIYRVRVLNKEGIHTTPCTKCGNKLVHVLIDTRIAFGKQPSTELFTIISTNLLYKY